MYGFVSRFHLGASRTYDLAGQVAVAHFSVPGKFVSFLLSMLLKKLWRGESEHFLRERVCWGQKNILQNVIFPSPKELGSNDTFFSSRNKTLAVSDWSCYLLLYVYIHGECVIPLTHEGKQNLTSSKNKRTVCFFVLIF